MNGMQCVGVDTRCLVDLSIQLNRVALTGGVGDRRILLRPYIDMYHMDTIIAV